MNRKSRMSWAVLASAALATGTIGLSPTASASPRGHELPGSVPSWARAAHKVGNVNDHSQVTFRVYQDWRGGDAAQQLATSVSTPGSADYGQFLTPAQFRSRFAPSAASTQTLENWLRGQGFKVTDVPANRKYVQVSGTLAQAASTFATGFANYRVQGQTVRGNTSPLSVPASMSNNIEAVVGLDQSQMLAQANKPAPPPGVFNNAGPCSTYWGEKKVDDYATGNGPATVNGTELPASPDYAFAPCGYAGAQLQGAYGMTGPITSGTDGSGVTIGVIDAYASPSIKDDANQYFGHVNAMFPGAKQIPPLTNNNFRQVVAPGTYHRATNKKQDPGGWAGEETLDIEAVHTMAPGANIVYIGAPNNYRDLDAIMNKVVDNHLADIVTNSYGYAGEALPNGYIKPSLDIQAQAATEGMSLLYSSGDNGDETVGVPGATPTPDWPASSPLVTAVGGTSLGVSQSKSREFELGWETGKECLTAATDDTCPTGMSPKTGGHWSAAAYQYGSGGGTSRLFAQPKYQAGVVPTSMSQTYGGQPMRVVPDVSALGDPTTGMLVGETQTWPDGHTGYGEYRIGGTSLASPLYAGMLALAEQQAGQSFGLANPRLYNARSTAYDITKADLGTYPGAVRPDYVNGVDGTDGYVYSVRLFDFDKPLTIHVAPNYDDVTGIGSPDGQAWLDAVASQ